MSGLITCKELLDENHHVVCFETQDAEAGVFNADERKGNTAYASLLLTVSNYAMAFSCFPPEPYEERRFWTLREYQRYLARFAQHFQLRDYIRFGTEVVSIEPWKGKGKDGLWLVGWRRGSEHQHEVFDAVAVCTGAFQNPKLPELPFVQSNGSRLPVQHAIDFQRGEDYLGKRVLCLGMGESGADIVHEIAGAAEATLLCVRPSPPPLIPRYDCEHIGPIPNDGETTVHRYGVFLNQYLSRFNATRGRDSHGRRLVAAATLSQLPTRISARSESVSSEERDRRTAAFIAEWNRRSYAGGLPFVSRFLTKNTIFVRDVVDGRLGVSFSELTRVDGRRCHFSDGTTFDADLIVCCTGYQDAGHPLFQHDPRLKQLLGSGIDPRKLFKHMFHPQLGKRLALIGFARPTQGMLPACAELQARYFALLCSNRRELPHDLEARTRAESAAEADMLQGDPAVRTLVQYPYFAEDMARLIGCSPRLSTQLRDPALAYKLFYGSMLSYRFRLDGPHARPELAKRVLKSLPVADTLPNQLALTVLNWRPAYEALAVATSGLDSVKSALRGVEEQPDLAFHAWGPRQLRQSRRAQTGPTPPAHADVTALRDTSSAASDGHVRRARAAGSHGSSRSGG